MRLALLAFRSIDELDGLSDRCEKIKLNLSTQFTIFISKFNSMTYFSKYNLRPADRIVCPLFPTGLTKHHALYLGADEYGNEMIAENDITVGVRIVLAEQFSKYHPTISRIEHFNGNEFQRQLAINTAIGLVGKPYDLFQYNCEHYANQVQNGVVISNQVKNFLCGVGLILFAWALIKE